MLLFTFLIFLSFEIPFVVDTSVKLPVVGFLYSFLLSLSSSCIGTHHPNSSFIYKYYNFRSWNDILGIGDAIRSKTVTPKNTKIGCLQNSRYFIVYKVGCFLFCFCIGRWQHFFYICVKIVPMVLLVRASSRRGLIFGLEEIPASKCSLYQLQYLSSRGKCCCPLL